MKLLQIFSELDELDLDLEEWVEKARWIKYEENVEELAERWGKPTISSLSFHALIELRKCLKHGMHLPYNKRSQPCSKCI